MRKFYTQAEAGTAPGEAGVSHVVRLDGQLLKTPLKHTLVLPTLQLAVAIAHEWRSQQDQIVPDTMPLTQLANTMVDKVCGSERGEMTEELCRYAGSDLICYLAATPPQLVARQEALWLPVLDWLSEVAAASLVHVHGIRYVEQDASALRSIRAYIDILSAADFTAVQAATGATGSVVLALALTAGRLTAQQAQDAACVDEIYQLEKWGEDKLARERLNRIARDLAACADFAALARI